MTIGDAASLLLSSILLPHAPISHSLTPRLDQPEELSGLVLDEWLGGE